MEQWLRNVEEGYDRVAQEYTARIFGELAHKPLDRALLDRFAEVVRTILTEAAEDPEIARNAPYTTPVRRLDEGGAARRPVVRQQRRDHQPPGDPGDPEPVSRGSL